MYSSHRSVLVQTLGVTAISLSVLFLGLMFYILFRPEGSSALLQILPIVKNIDDAGYYAKLFNWLPSFVHVLSFTLLTWLLLSRRMALLCATAWCSINLYFEFSQIDNLTPTQFPGTFDPADVASCIVAAIVAMFMMKTIEQRNLRHEHTSTGNL